MSTITPSKEQVTIFDYIKNKLNNLLISAVAGSGKTTTLLMLLGEIPSDKRILFMAYNKSIADELRKRVPVGTTNVDITTVHGYGYRIIETNSPVEIDKNKYNKYLNAIVDSIFKKNLTVLDKFDFTEMQKDYAKRIGEIFSEAQKREKDFKTTDYLKIIKVLCGNGRLNLIDTLNLINGVEHLKLITKHHGLESKFGAEECAWYLIKIGQLNRKVIDFTDMITYPIIFNMKQPKYDFVFIDECQDINICQRILMQGAMEEKTGRFIAVGDEKQAIYGFAGADSQSFNEIRNLPNTKELNLSVSYRCPKQVVDLVKYINPLIEHNKGNEDGKIINNFEINDLNNGDMVLCRYTKPLVSLCMDLIKGGKKAYLMGSDIGSSLANLILEKEKDKDEFTMTNVYGKLYKDLDKLLESIMTKENLRREEAENEDVYLNLKERIEMIEIIGENEEDPFLVLEKIKSLFSDLTTPGICLSTVHKSKGLEAERVVILNPSLMPSPRATLPWQVTQENNLIYVAYTRSKKTLGFIHNYEKNHASKKDAMKLIKESNHIGYVGQRMRLVLTITQIREVSTKFGKRTVTEFIDNSGNVFSYFGEVSVSLLDDDEKFVASEEDIVRCYAIISEHSEFANVKITKLKKLTNF